MKSPFKIWLVHGEHHVVPGALISAHLSRQGADERAAELVGLITGKPSTPITWMDDLERWSDSDEGDDAAFVDVHDLDAER